MKANPVIAPYGDQFAIFFVTASSQTLAWAQDLWSRKTKRTELLPPVVFASYEDAEREVREQVIPYLLQERKVNPEEIVGW